MSTHNIGVIGIGKLGLSFALLAERSGYIVHRCDLRKDYIKNLANKGYFTSEPFINDYLTDAKQILFDWDCHSTVRDCDILFCFVATPSLPDGSYDHSAIDRVVADLQELHVRGM